MPDPTRIPAGAQAPYEVVYLLRSSRIDLTRSTLARFVLRRAKGTGPIEEWSAILRNKQARSVEVVHLLQDGDVPIPDDIVIEPRVLTTLGPGELVGRSRVLTVFAHPERLP